MEHLNQLLMIMNIVKGLKERTALNETSPIIQLRDVTCHMGSHSVICPNCHPTQVNAPRLNPSQ